MRKFLMLTVCAVSFFSAQAATNLVSNGDFSQGKTDWVAGKWETGWYNDFYDNNEFKAVIVQPGGANWQCFFYHFENIILKAGVTYTYHFDAYASEDAQVPIAVKHVGQNVTPWLQATAAVTTTKQTFSYTFTTTADDDSGQVNWSLGMGVFVAGDTFHLSNVSIVDAAAVLSRSAAVSPSSSLRVAGRKATVTLTHPASCEMKLYTLKGALVADYTSSLKGAGSGAHQIDLLSHPVSNGAYVLKLRDGAAVTSAAVMIGR
jgi:endoglucanase